MNNDRRLVGEMDSPRDLNEANVMIVALVGAFQVTAETLAEAKGGYHEDWITELEQSSIRAAKGTQFPAGTPETVDAEATRKAMELLGLLFLRLRGRVV